MKPKLLPLDHIAMVARALEPQAAALKDAKVLVTGAAGFLGQWFVAVLKLLAKEVVELDLANGWDVTTAPLGSHYHFIIHAAGNASPRVYRRRPLATIDVAVRGTQRLLELAHHCEATLLVISSSEIYGNPRQVPTPEDDLGQVSCRGPRACYDESKRLAETLSQVYFDQFGVRVVTVRPFNVYGPGMRLDDGRVVAQFAKRLLEGQPLIVYGDGRQTRTYCYVTDAITGCLLALLRGRPGSVYNIGAPGPELSAHGLAAVLLRVAGSDVGVKVEPYPEDYPCDEPLRRCPNLSRAVNELGYLATTRLPEGLRDYLEWAR